MVDSHAVAITGLSCRFPGEGDTLEKFWDSICSGKSAWSKIPQDRFNVDSFWSPSNNRNTSRTRGGHFLQQDISTFDAAFFGLPKTDVEAMDPQHRIMLEVAYEALERAGLPLEKIAGTKTGVFMGHFTSDYKEMIYRDPDNAPLYSLTGSSTTSLANRISWLWDLKGPSFTVDTACSSSLVALHLACQSLRTGESDIAIVGASSLLLNPEMFMYLSNQAFLSPDGKCKSFDESANGYGRGEGFGCVLLKRVDDAVVAGDAIRAVIRGTASNQDGHTTGFTLPSAESQAALIEDVYQLAGLDYRETAYVEAHGTGTQAGDSLETEALAKTIASSHTAQQKLIVGSVKSNIGHLEAAAGIAGIIKAVLMLESGLIPPSIHFKKGNPKIKFEKWNIKIPTGPTLWPNNGVRRISINSFGFGGTNAHAILDDAHHFFKGQKNISVSKKHAVVMVNGMKMNGNKANGTVTGTINGTINGTVNGIVNDTVNGAKTNSIRAKSTTIGDHTPSSDHSMPRLVVLSAQDRDGLRRVKESLATYVQVKAMEPKVESDDEKSFMSKFSYTMNERRSRHQWKTYVISSDPKGLASALDDKDSPALVVQSSRSPRVGFVFTGQGAQWPRMGVELMVYKAFSDSVNEADIYLREVCKCSYSVVEELHKPKSTSRLYSAECSHVLCTVLQVALVRLLESWNIVPHAVVGHSGGETAASYALGALTKEEVWKIAYCRGFLASRMRTDAVGVKGSMMVTGLSHEKAEDWISKITDRQLVIACINSPTSVTISGDTAGIDHLYDMLEKQGIFARKLMIDLAYHSPHMQLIANDYSDLLADLNPRPPPNNRTMHSSVTGSIVEADQLGAAYWVSNMTSPVRFSEAIYDTLRPVKGGKRRDENAVDVLIEIGPHSALLGPSIQTLKEMNIVNVPYYSVINRNKNAMETAMNLAGIMLAQGYNVNTREVNQDADLHFSEPLVDLPTYPWMHQQRFWHQSRFEREYLTRGKPKLSLLGAPSLCTGERERIWRGFIRLSEEPWLADHKIQGAILFPAAGYLSMAMEAAAQTVDAARRVSAYSMKEIHFSSAAIITEEYDLECIVQLRPYVTSHKDSFSKWTEFVVTTCAEGQTLTRNCSGLLSIEYEPAENSEVSHERRMEHETLKVQRLKVKEACKHRLGVGEFYANLKSQGLEYGLTFANVCEVHNRDGQSTGVIQIPKVPFGNLEGSGGPGIIYPGTLDSIFHLAFAAGRGNQDNPSAATVPKFIDEIMVSTNTPSRPGTKLLGFSNAARHGPKQLMADIFMLDDIENTPIVVVKGFLCAEVAGATSSSTDGRNVRSIASKLTWKPEINLFPFDKLSEVLQGTTVLETLFDYLALLHHSKPALAILEAIIESRDSDPVTPLLYRNELRRMFITWDATIACRDETMKTRLDEDPISQKTRLEILNFSDDQPEVIPDDELYDVLIARDIESSDSIPELVVEHMIQVLKVGGKICVLLSDRLLSRVQNVLDNNDMKMTVVRRPGTAELQDVSLLIAERQYVSFTNRMNVVTRNTESEQTTLVLPATPTKKELELSSKLNMILTRGGHEVCVFSWDSDISALAGKSCISLLEFQKTVLRDLTEEDFGRVKQLVLSTAKLLWVTGLDDPSASLIDGLFRTVRNEVPGLALSTLQASDTFPMTAEEVAELISRAFTGTGKDDEFRIMRGILHISRIEEDTTLSENIDSLLPGTSKMVSRLPLGQLRYPVKLAFQSPGLLDTTCMEEDVLTESELEADLVEIQVKATALNFRDVMVAMGQISDSKLGFDAAGVVHRIGSAVTKFKVGDKVMMYGHGAHRTFHRSREIYCSIIPEGLSFEQASTIPTVHGTAWNALVRLARVRKGQSILIQAAAGGVGQAAIQIAKHFGMEIFVTVSSDTKRELIRDQYGILDDHIFSSRELSFVKGIKRITNGRGVDVILNSLSGEALRQSWHCIAPFGFFIEIGITDILENSRLDMRPFIQDATFTFFNLNHIERSRPDVMGEILEGTFDFIHQGITRPVEPLLAFPVSEAENAFRLMQTGKHSGKIALTWDEHEVIPTLQRRRIMTKLNSDAVYLLAGGLGGVGRSLASKLVRLGARKLCFFSRSGSNSLPAKELVRELQDQNVRVEVYKCDISDNEALSSAIQSCTHELGHIRGVFQCAMVLRDTSFVNMTYPQWSDTTRAKVQGSWNLHKNFPEVDFFIMLSSIGAIFGNRGQSNYAAAGAFEDALAYHRRALGQHATAIDLGIMRGIGVLADTEESRVEWSDNYREWEEPYGIREQELHALVERIIDPTAIMPTQVLTGLATGGSAVSVGIRIPFYLEDARFSIMARTGMRENASLTARDSIPTHILISQAKSLEIAAGLVMESLVKQVAKMLQTSTSEIDTGRFLHSYGVDSLVAIEIVNWAYREPQTMMTVFDVLAAVPITTLCNKIAINSKALPRELLV